MERSAEYLVVANVVTGFFGGMGDCTMTGQTMINVKASGARTRIATVVAPRAEYAALDTVLRAVLRQRDADVGALLASAQRDVERAVSQG